MKKLFTNQWLLQRGLFVVLFCFSLLNLNAQNSGKLIFSDHFDYAVGDIVGKGNWQREGIAGSSNILTTVEGGLTYPKYSAQAIGNSLQTRIISGQKVFASIEGIESGSAYFSALIKIDSIKGSGADYFMSFARESDPSKHFAKLYAKGLNDKKFTIGVMKTQKTNYGSQEFSWGDTLLIIVKYEFVSGDANDKITVWVNPTIGDNEDPKFYIQNKFSTEDWGVDGIETSEDIDKIGSIVIRQSTTAPLAVIDAVRIATSWKSLFNDEVDEPSEPKITLIPNKGIDFGIGYTDYSYTQNIEVKGERLNGDINLSLKSGKNVEISKTSISKEDASLGGSLTVTLKQNHELQGMDTLLFVSTAVETIIYPILWSSYTPTPISNLSLLRNEASKNPNNFQETLYQLTGEILITHINTSDNGLAYTQIFAQDANAAITINDKKGILTQSYQVGDKISHLIGNLELSFGSLAFVPFRDFSNAISKNNPLTPTSTTLKEIKANPGNFESRLISLDTVYFPNRTTEGDGIFTVGKTVSMEQAEILASESFKLRPIVGLNFIGDSIPTKANIIGIVTAGSGKLVAPRSKADIISLDTKTVSDNLLQNPSFEEWESKVGLFGWKALEWETNSRTEKDSAIVLNGQYSLKVAEAVANFNKVEQEIVAPFSNSGQYELSFNYFVIKSVGGKDIQIRSEWLYKGVGLPNDANILNNNEYFTSVGKWENKKIITNSPKEASSFLFNLGVAKGVIALFDNFSFKAISDGKPVIRLNPENISTMTAKVDSTVVSTKINVKGLNLEEDIQISISGDHAVYFKTSKTSLVRNNKNIEDTLEISYKPTVAGRHFANVEFTSGNIVKIIELIGVATPNPSGEKPKITISETEKSLTAKVGESKVDSVLVSASDLTDYIYISLTGDNKEHFLISTSMMGKTPQQEPFRITYRPKSEGEHTAYILFRSKGADTITLVVKGKSGSSTIDPENPEFNTKFVLDTTHPTSKWIQNFDNVIHNKQIADSIMQNVVFKWNRPWWGFDVKDENQNVTQKVAKATGYVYQQPKEDSCEMWLLTPALDFKNAKSKLFTFRVMGEFMTDNQKSKLELYYIEKEGDGHYQNKVEIDIPSIADENGVWREFHMDLTGQNIADIFFMGFRFSGLSGSNQAATYYIDEVSFGREDLPQIICETQKVVLTAPVYAAVESSIIQFTTKNVNDEVVFKVFGANPSKFTVSSPAITENGGSFKIQFSPLEIGIHSAFVQISSRGAADIIIELEGRSIPNEPKILISEADLNIKLSLESGSEINSKPIIVNPFLLTQAIQISLEGTNATQFKLSKTSIAKDAINESFVITYKPSEGGAHNAKVRLRSEGAEDVVINLTATQILGLNSEIDSEINIIRSNDGFIVEHSSLTEISVYTISGQKIFNKLGAVNSILIPIKQKGIYIIKTTTRKGVQNTKVIW